MSKGRRHYLYVIAANDGPCKIGISRHPRQRLANLQTGSAYPLKLHEVWYFGGAEQAQHAEDLAHLILCDCPLSGEWFNCTPAKAIERINTVLHVCFMLESVSGAKEFNNPHFGMFKNGWVADADRVVLP